MNDDIQTPTDAAVPADKPVKVKKTAGQKLTRDGVLRRALQAKTVEEFTTLLAGYKPSNKLLRDALVSAQKDGQSYPLLEEYLTLNGKLAAARGRAGPKAGETRVYSVQAISEKNEETGVVKVGTPFLRIPLDSLGLCKKDLAKVQFKEDRIIIRKKAAPSDTETVEPVQDTVPVEEIAHPAA